ncbi:MAG: prolipoprotein diacylglyceryl transferase [Hyphomonadaceae bacterium]|nr:prolipoprotein diacylglyceryl transferase [Clostridia bacterium]
MTPIDFPGLALHFQIERVAFSVLGLDVYWYGLIIGIGFFIALMIAFDEAKRVELSTDDLTDVILWATPVSIVCARLYYVVFQWDLYRNDLWQIFAIRDGGIAIYGAVIGAFVTSFLVARHKKLPILRIFDIGGLAFLLAQAIGRWGNFVNQEAYGGTTSLPWRMQLTMKDGSLQAVHPTFFYESIWNFFGFLMLWALRRWAFKPTEQKQGTFKKGLQHDGGTFFLYVIWYGLGRAWIEGLRQDSLYLGSLRISQLLALFSVAFSAIFLLHLCKMSKIGKK